MSVESYNIFSSFGKGTDSNTTLYYCELIFLASSVVGNVQFDSHLHGQFNLNSFKSCMLVNVFNYNCVFELQLLRDSEANEVPISRHI